MSRPLLPSLVVAALGGIIFSTLLFRPVFTDFPLHIEIAQRVLSQRSLPPHFLYFISLQFLSAFTNSTLALEIATILLLCAALTGKFLVSRQFLLWREDRKIKLSIYSLAAIFLLFAFSLPVKSFGHWTLLVGQIPPNLWQNSTTIFAMPFVILLFWKSYQYLLDPQPKQLRYIFLLSLMNIFSKPSFFMVFAAVYPFFVWAKFGYTKASKGAILTVLLASLFFVGQVLFSLPQRSSFPLYSDYHSHIGLGWFVTPRRFTDHIFWSLVASIAFPLAELVFNYKRLLKDWLYRYTLTLFITGLLVIFFVSETGSKESGTLFIWQCFPLCYLLFLVSLKSYLGRLNPQSPLCPSEKLIGVVFFLQVAAGLSYLGLMFLRKTYMC